MSALAVILGSAFSRPLLGGKKLEKEEVTTSWGVVELYRYPRPDGEAWVLYRHGAPHRYLPHQIPYRAMAAALSAVQCQGLLLTSSVGVLTHDLPLDAPLLLSDLLMPDNRLPDGSACTMFPQPTPGQGHLVLDEGIFSSSLSAQIEEICQQAGTPLAGRAVFAYSGGPRTKTAAENQWWTRLGAQVNSMTIGPEAVLANELAIPCAGLVVGHKYSIPNERDRLSHSDITASLRLGREGLEQLVCRYLEQGQPVSWGNRLYRYEATE